jgi:hypothetical protein
MRRAAILWAAAFVLLFAGFGASVVALNSNVYSAHGFALSYLDDLARKDSSAALALPGVVVPKGVGRELLVDDALGTLSEIRFVSEKKLPDATYRVVLAYRLADGTHSSEFIVQPSGTRLGLFSRWRFAVSPLATLPVTVLHAATFTVNGVAATTGSSAGAAKDFLVFSPGLYVLDHASTYLSANNVRATITGTGSTTQAVVETFANAKFVHDTTRELTTFLNKCATQQVLMPTACPFGEFLDNRINDLPTWSMVEYPTVSLVPGTLEGEWLVQKAPAIAHIVVEQKSVFDGSLTTIDENVPFTADYSVTISQHDALEISAILD